MGSATEFLGVLGVPDFLTKLQALYAVPGNKVEAHAQPLLSLAKAHQPGAKAYGNIFGMRTTAALVGVAKSLWLTCPPIQASNGTH